MSLEIEQAPHQSAASLVAGILGDFQNLVEQQLRLAAREIEDGVSRRVGAGIVVAIAAGLLLTGCFALCLSAANLMHWLASPLGTDPAWFPLWACYASLSLVFGAASSIAFSVGRRRLKCAVASQLAAHEFSGE